MGAVCAARESPDEFRTALVALPFAGKGDGKWVYGPVDNSSWVGLGAELLRHIGSRFASGLRANWIFEIDGCPTAGHARERVGWFLANGARNWQMPWVADQTLARPFAKPASETHASALGVYALADPSGADILLGIVTFEHVRSERWRVKIADSDTRPDPASRALLDRIAKDLADCYAPADDGETPTAPGRADVKAKRGRSVQTKAQFLGDLEKGFLEICGMREEKKKRRRVTAKAMASMLAYSLGGFNKAMDRHRLKWSEIKTQPPR